jgi:hypothetical protein
MIEIESRNVLFAIEERRPRAMIKNNNETLGETPIN